jgi:hypothetical protein
MIQCLNLLASASTRDLFMVGVGQRVTMEERILQILPPVEMPTLFHFQIAEFFDWNGERRGGIGQIEEPEHIYDGYWLLFYMRQVLVALIFPAELQTIISTLVRTSLHYFRRARIHKWQKLGRCQIFPIAHQFGALAELE